VTGRCTHKLITHKLIINTLITNTLITQVVKCMGWAEFLQLGKDTECSLLYERIAKIKPTHCCSLVYTSVMHSTSPRPPVPPSPHSPAPFLIVFRFRLPTPPSSFLFHAIHHALVENYEF
jgi:hypothetical protein